MRMGAYAKTIRENGPDSSQPRIKHLFNHNSTQPLGKIITLKEDNIGLYYESQIGTHNLGQDFVKMVESGLITEHSVGFQAIKNNQLQNYDGYKANPGGGWFEITEVKLYEGSSLSAWGANPNTPITDMKGEEKEAYLSKLVARQASIEKFCRNSNASDEAIEALLIENKQLTQMLIELHTTQPQPGTAPVSDNVALVSALKSFNQIFN